MKVVTDDGIYIGQIENIKVFDDLFWGLSLPPRGDERIQAHPSLTYAHHAMFVGSEEYGQGFYC